MKNLVKKIACAIVLFGLHAPNLYPATYSQSDVKVVVSDYSRQPMKAFFSDLGKDYEVLMMHMNGLNKVYPVRVTVHNDSAKKYRLTKDLISASLRIDYKKLNKEMVIMSPKAIGGAVLAAEGIIFGGVFGVLTALIHDSDRGENQGFRDHLKDCGILKFFTGTTAVLGGLGLLSTMYTVAKFKNIRKKRLKWLKRYALPKEGITINPGQSAEVVIFLTEQGYNNDRFVIELRASGYDDDYLSFQVSFLG